MLNKPILVATALLGVSALPTQAAAAPLAISVPSAMPMAAFGLSQVNCGMQTAAASPTASAAYRGSSQSRSAAILGGRPSALERLKMQQAGQIQPDATTATLAPALPVAGSAVMPVAAVGFACASPQKPSAAIIGQRQPAVTGTFLGTERVRIGKTRFDAKWNGVVNRDLSGRDLSRTVGAVPSDRNALLAKVNRWVNRSIAYQDDAKGDAWAAASETLRKRSGDCEDYAILKMHLLHAAGVAKDDMMLTLARDNMAGNDHAVLLVRNGGAAGRDWVMLDMGSDRIVPAAADYGYRPVVSFAGNTRYLHGMKYDPDSARAGNVRFAMAN